MDGLVKLLEHQAQSKVAGVLITEGVAAGAMLAILMAGWFGVIGPLAHRLRALCGDVTQGANEVEAVSSMVSGSSQNLAQRAVGQADSTQEMSASAQEISSLTVKNNESARLAVTLVETVGHDVQRANLDLAQMEISMRAVQSSTDRIGKIVKTIDGIAFQTNILALNAAVEAARAGAAGASFAVVADEVRSLAQRSAQASKDTADLVATSVVTSHDGTVRLADVTSAMSRITVGAERLIRLVSEVGVGSESQLRGVDSIVGAISRLVELTQSTAAIAEESAAAGEQLNAQAATSRQTANMLRTMVGDR
jgi:methyl-accepting chemotaxis protein